MNRVNRWLLRPRVMAGIALAVFACIVLFQWPASPASGARFTALTGEAPFDERPAGYALSGVLAAFRQLGPRGLVDYECYRAVDAVFPWLLCALVAAVMLRLDAARATMWPWLAALADSAENALQFAILVTRRDLSPELVQWASAATQLKFVMYALMLLMLLAVGARTLWRQHRALR